MYSCKYVQVCTTHTYTNIKGSMAEMLGQAGVLHLVREGRKIGASRQDVLVELLEGGKFARRDAYDLDVPVPLPGTAVRPDAPDDVLDVKMADAQPASVPRCNAQQVQIEVLQLP